MSGAAHSSRRLQRLAQILAESSAVLEPASSPDADLADVHLGRVPLARIGRLTSELRQRGTVDIDDIDRVAMRMLLSDYAAAVAHLRATARLAEQRLADAAAPIQEMRLLIRRRDKLAAGAKRKPDPSRG